MPKLAHISDIHFGGTFDVDTWKNVRTQIETFKPDILVVSGDLVDHPWPFKLLAVKSELDDLCIKCSSKPQLFVVPGNHDLRLWGNVRLRLWPGWLDRLVLPGWFERILFNNTSAAKQKIETDLGIKLGLNEDCKRLTWRRWLKRFKPANWIRRNVSKDQCDGRLQSCDRRRGDGLWPTESEYRQIAIACFDSNPAKGGGLAFATGEVGGNQVTRLGRKHGTARPAGCSKCASSASPTTSAESTAAANMASANTDVNTASMSSTADAILLRVAVLHHHPLPIALASASLKKKRREGILEPYLVLRNSGDLLQKLQQQRFDLILHGHKHKSQFARLELKPGGTDRYPLTVLAAGSTAKDDEDDNTLRLIHTEPNGRLTVETIECDRPDDPQKQYREELAQLKQRAFVRATERTKRVCNSLHWAIKIDAIGNIRIVTAVDGFRVLRDGESVEGIPFNVVVPPHGQRFDDLNQFDESCRDLMKLCWRAEDGNLHDLNAIPVGCQGCCWIQLHQKLEPGSVKPLSYSISNPVSNSIAMNSWELKERSRVNPGKYDSQYESIWRYVSYPTDRLEMRLELPTDLDGVQPFLRCLRPYPYPDSPLTYLPKVATNFDYDRFYNECVADLDLQAEEKHKLRYEPLSRTWCLDIDRPIPGYVYELRWKVPLAIADNWVTACTTEYQKMLLGLRDRLAREAGSEGLSAPDLQCRDLFNEFGRTLMGQLASLNPEERQAVFLMVYDRADLNLYPVLWCTQGALEEKHLASFKVPLGGGVAGAAFLQHRVFAWGKDPDSDSLISPEPLPGLDIKYVLAVPIFYRQRARLVTEPGAVIGVVTVASDAPASGIARLRGVADKAKERRDEVQLVAQAVVTGILERLSQGARVDGTGMS